MAANLIVRLDEELKQSLKRQDKARLSTVRMIKSAIKYREIEVGHPLDDSEVMQTLSRMAKQRRESIEQFEQGGRHDLAAKENQELEIINSFLPQMLSREELEGIVDETIAELGARTPKEMGKVMAALMTRIQGRAEGKEASSIVRAKLGA